MKRKKVYLYPRNTLDKEMLAGAFDLTGKAGRADHCISWKADVPGIPESRTVMVQTEPPVAGAVCKTYRNKDKYLKFIGFPEFDSPFYPYMPAFNFELQTHIGSGIYYAGMKRPDRKSQGCDIIYGLRTRIAYRLQTELGGVCLGRGWDRNTKGPKGDPHTDGDVKCSWHKQKFIDIQRFNPKYILSVENTRMPGYVTEKFNDGILSGRPMIYLGAPDVLDRVPADIFINLGPFYKDHDLDWPAAIDYIQSFSDAELMQMVERGKQWLHANQHRPEQDQRKWTRVVIETIREAQ